MSGEMMEKKADSLIQAQVVAMRLASRSIAQNESDLLLNEKLRLLCNVVHAGADYTLHTQGVPWVHVAPTGQQQ
jgi:hypothetical protein